MSHPFCANTLPSLAGMTGIHVPNTCSKTKRRRENWFCFYFVSEMCSVDEKGLLYFIWLVFFFLMSLFSIFKYIKLVDIILHLQMQRCINIELTRYLLKVEVNSVSMIKTLSSGLGGMICLFKMIHLIPYLTLIMLTLAFEIDILLKGFNVYPILLFFGIIKQC